MIKIFTDGGSRGNPGPSAIGVVIYDSKNTLIHSISKCIGWTTNNVAEYSAMMEALMWIESRGQIEKESSAHIFTDSLLVYSQIVGLFKIKNPVLKKIYQKIKVLESKSKIPLQFSHILRDKNTAADMLVNKALDIEMQRM